MRVQISKLNQLFHISWLLIIYIPIGSKRFAFNVKETHLLFSETNGSLRNVRRTILTSLCLNKLITSTLKEQCAFLKAMFRPTHISMNHVMIQYRSAFINHTPLRRKFKLEIKIELLKHYGQLAKKRFHFRVWQEVNRSQVMDAWVL